MKTSIQEYPLVLTAKEVSEILSISLRRAYELMDENDFPLVRFSRSKRVLRDAFCKWMISKQNENSYFKISYVDVGQELQVINS